MQWFRSFLTGRTQRVKIDGVYSDSLDVPFGAPQGSVLGPKLFNVNVRSQPLVFKYCRFNSSSFADDSNGRRSFALTFQFNVLKYQVPKVLREIIQWSNEHFKKINPGRTDMMLLRPPSLRWLSMEFCLMTNVSDSRIVSKMLAWFLTKIYLSTSL